MQNNAEEPTTDIPLIVRVSDPKTGDTTYDEYVVHNVQESIAEELDAGNYDGIFRLLFAEYPEDFPEEEPGVDAEITGYTLNWSDFN